MKLLNCLVTLASFTLSTIPAVDGAKVLHLLRGSDSGGVVDLKDDVNGASATVVDTFTTASLPRLRYVPRHDYIAGPSNPIADALSREFQLAWSEILAILAPYLPTTPQIWTPSPQFVAAVLAALLQRHQPPESVLLLPAVPSYAGRDQQARSPATIEWPSTPFSKPSSTKYHTYRSSHDEFIGRNLLPQVIPSSLDRLKITYGSLPRRPPVWGPKSSI